jgi:glutamate synthase (NADPH/NADH) large chain
MVDVSHDLTHFDAIRLKQLIVKHLHYTNSDVARHILDHWAELLPHFVKVMPVDYRNALEQMQSHQSRPPGSSGPYSPKIKKEVVNHG